MNTFRAALLSVVFCFGITFAEEPERREAGPHVLMTSTIRDLLTTLSDDQRAKIRFPFEDAERLNWHFVPRERRGLPLKEMSEAQVAVVMDLLGAALSETGAAKAKNVLLLEGVLGELESAGGAGRAGFRDPEMYFLTLFGEPSENEPWGWRFEGHHLSLNFTTLSGLVVGTPAFYGANPAKVPPGMGRSSGLRVLEEEEDLGRELVQALNDAQKTRAVFSANAPRDIVTGAAETASPGDPVGLPFSAMNEDQRAMLRRLVAVYVDNMDTDIAAGYWRRIEERGWDGIHFAWAGRTEPGEGHYYRIQGPSFLIEYDNVQNNGNHVHSVLRDLENDWGKGSLRQHYEQHAH